MSKHKYHARTVSLLHARKLHELVACVKLPRRSALNPGFCISCTWSVNREKHPSGIIPVLQNVVSTVNLGCKLDLKEIALHARNAEYNPKVRGKKTRLCIYLLQS